MWGDKRKSVNVIDSNTDLIQNSSTNSLLLPKIERTKIKIKNQPFRNKHLILQFFNANDHFNWNSKKSDFFLSHLPQM